MSPRISERPILFRAEMVRAILEGRKWQTRRKVRPRWPGEPPAEAAAWERQEIPAYTSAVLPFSPWGRPGDRLWVQEPYGLTVPAGEVVYHASEPYRPGVRWLPSLKMPRALVRLVLEITDVRRERVLAITDDDALAEGIVGLSKDGGRTTKYGMPAPDGLPAAPGEPGWPWDRWCATPREAYLQLWTSQNRSRRFSALETDPIVTVLEFTPVVRP